MSIAEAKTSFSFLGPLNNSTALSPQVHISYGQSWRSNVFPDFGSFGFNPQGPLALRVSSIGTPTFAAGPLPNSAGISLPSSVVGVQNYASTDVFAIGRCAILALQLLRIAAGEAAPPIIEACFAYPSSTWTSGGGGGLAPGASFTASVVNDLMTVTAVASGVLTVGQQLTASGITSGTRIIALGTGTGGTGTYTIGIPQTVLSETITGSGVGASSFVGSIGAGSPDTVLTVTALNSGAIVVGQTITGTSILAGTKIGSFGTGVGGVGTYNTEVGSPQNVGSEAFTGTNVSWANQLTVIRQLSSLVPPKLNVVGGVLRLTSPTYRSVGYTQGGATDNTEASKIADLAAMFVAYDALALNGTDLAPLNFYLGLPAAISTATVFPVSNFGTVDFCRTNAPGAGGTYSGRAWFSSCSYPWQFNGADNIHTGAYGSARWGEWEGYVKHLVEDLGVQWKPLWLSLSRSISVGGQQITVPFDRPSSPDFASANMVWQDNADDGIKDWPQQGFHVKRSGVDLTVTPAISGLNVVLSIAETLNPSDVLEVSYAWYGPGGTNPGANSGVGGNLTMNGPTSVLFPNGHNGAAKTIDAWACPFLESITV